MKKVLCIILAVSSILFTTCCEISDVDRPIKSSRKEFLQSKAPSESGYIYYSTGNNIVRIKSGDENEEDFTDFFADYLFIVGEWVYYYDYRNDGATYTEPILHRRKEDGSLDEAVIDTPVKSVSYHDGYIYYMPGEKFTYGLYRANPDGSQPVQISDESLNCYYFEDDCLYLLNSSSDIIRMDYEGGSRKLIIGGEKYSAIGISDVFFDQSYIYYIGDLLGNWLNNRYIFRTDKDGQHEKQLTELSVDNFILSGRYIYFIGGKTSISDQFLYKMPVSGGEPKKISHRKLPDYDSFMGYDGEDIYIKFVDVLSGRNDGFESATFYKIKCDR